MVDAVETDVEDDASVAGGDGVGIAAFVAGCLALGPVAIVLGAIGLARWRSGAASRRSWPLAGLVLGVVGTLLLLAGWLLHVGTERSEGTVLAHAQVDVITVGNALVARHVADPQATDVDVVVEDDAYVVAGDRVPRVSADVAAVSYAGSTAWDWCVTLVAGADGSTTVGYAATAGLVEACPAG